MAFLTWVLLGMCLLVTSGCATNALAPHSSTDPVRIMTFNIRYDEPNDGENAWQHRRTAVVDLVRFYKPAFLGVQESMSHQQQAMQDDLAGFAAFGVGRDDGGNGGEFSAVFVRTSDFDVVDSGTFWLSETPATPSVGWDADFPRIATWVRAICRRDGNEFLVANTHWDHKGVIARQQSADLVRRWLEAHRQSNETVVLMGDFNAAPSTEPYRRVLIGDLLVDTRTLSETPPLGPAGTFSGFDIFRSEAEPIDHVFSTPDVRVFRYGVITQHSGGQLPSDHYPVVVDMLPN
jgi:endonuclease/exonuclease/phosphatase family metal-dependent hydrolase